MTRFASPAVIACPHCQYLALRQRLSLINLGGATRWSDGFIACFPGLPSFTRCARCKGVYWLEDAEVVGTLPDRREGPPRGFWRRFFARPSQSFRRNSVDQSLPDEWMWAQPVEHPDIDALAIGIEGLDDDETPEREQRLRRLLWWRFNDHHRASDRTAPGVSAAIRTAHERSNLLRLLDLSRDGDSVTNIEHVELLRELGRFDEAQRALALIKPDVVGVTLLSAKIDARDAMVCITQQEAW